MVTLLNSGSGALEHQGSQAMLKSGSIADLRSPQPTYRNGVNFKTLQQNAGIMKGLPSTYRAESLTNLLGAQNSGAAITAADLKGFSSAVKQIHERGSPYGGDKPRSYSTLSHTAANILGGNAHTDRPQRNRNQSVLDENAPLLINVPSKSNFGIEGY